MKQAKNLPAKWIEFRTDRFTLKSAVKKFIQVTGKQPKAYYCTGFRWCIW